MKGADHEDQESGESCQRSM